MAAYLLDTNIISAILKRNEDGARLNDKIKSILKANDDILFCPVVFYEIIRGLYHKKADKQLAFFERIAGCFEWRDLTKNTWDTGARLWAECRMKGTPTGDGGDGIDKDVLIAAQAKEHNAVVITRNERHFQHFGVLYEIW